MNETTLTWGRPADGSITWYTGDSGHTWYATPEDGRFAVRYRTNERMRLGADGTLSFGEPQPYWFQTREWAEACAKRLNEMDAAFAERSKSTPWYMTTTSNNHLGIGTTAPVFRIQVTHNAKPLLEVAPSGEIVSFDLPAFVRGWWRGTGAHRALQRLLWGDRGRA